MTILDVGFREVVLVDFEYQQLDGECPVPVCVVAHELVSGRRHRLMLNEKVPTQPPYPVDEETLFVAYYASAEMGCHLALGWKMPTFVLDLFAEFRCLTNGLTLPGGNSLLDALVYCGLDGMDAVEKEGMRQLAMRGGRYTQPEQQSLLDYCESDVIALERLLNAMLPKLDIFHGVHRGRYMKACALMERAGIPIDSESLNLLRDNWDKIQARLILRVNAGYDVYEGRTFKAELFAAYLAQRGIDWPRLESGRLALDDNTFKERATVHPELEPLRQLRVTLSKMRLSALAVGADSRNRSILSAFSAKTSRNQPSNTRLVFGPAAWMRSLIKPHPGQGLAYIDWAQQEFGIAAALSGDEAMLEAYSSGDPYLAFAQQAGAAPGTATKHSHEAVREQFKQCTLAVQYGMGADSLAIRIGQQTSRAVELLELHRTTYPIYWRWSQELIDHTQLRQAVNTVFGWTLQLDAQTKTNWRSISNFPMQGNGAEMLRLACCLATERGVTVCAPIHDALLIEAPLATFEEAISTTQLAMNEASETVLSGLRLRSDVKRVLSPDRFMDRRGEKMWHLVWEEIRSLASAEPTEMVTPFSI
jgi:DNA polymerase-1